MVLTRWHDHSCHIRHLARFLIPKNFQTIRKGWLLMVHRWCIIGANQLWVYMHGHQSPWVSNRLTVLKSYMVGLGKQCLVKTSEIKNLPRAFSMRRINAWRMQGFCLIKIRWKPCENARSTFVHVVPKIIHTYIQSDISVIFRDIFIVGRFRNLTFRKIFGRFGCQTFWNLDVLTSIQLSHQLKYYILWSCCKINFFVGCHDFTFTI